MKLIFTLIFSAFFAVYGIYFFKFHGPLSSGQDIWGQFGDFVGGTLNPILSFITIYLLYKTIVLQQESLQKTQESLALSRDSYELSKTELRDAPINLPRVSGKSKMHSANSAIR
ncbi:hypothetical protein XJ28_01260 [Pseudomonas syringae pv. tomato]|nr:hypothetical protein XJ28_01260 [Pseudomonas syringae pv. tomato]